MSISILHTHTGSILSGGPVSFRSLDGLKAWVARETSINQNNQILLTARGKPVKPQNLETEQHIFLYDRKLLATPPDATHNLQIRNPSTAPSTVKEAPLSIPRDSPFHVWQRLFKERQKWAVQIVDDSRSNVEQILQLEQERHVIQQGTAIAISNVKQHLGNLNPKYEETKNWADQICEDQGFLLERWRDRLDKLKFMTTIHRFGRLFRTDKAKSVLEGSSHTDIKLYDLVNPHEVQEAGDVCQQYHREFSERVLVVKRAYDSVASESDRVAEDFQSLTTLSDSEIPNRVDGLMEEVEVLAGKIAADNETIQNLPNTPKATVQASKTSHTHETSFVNALVQTHEEIRVLLQQVIDLKDDITKSSLQHLQQISFLESSIQTTHSLLADLNLDPKSSHTFDTLNFAVRLPATYGSLLVEALRRREYFLKWSGDRPPLGGESIAVKAEENKRRQRWANEMGSVLDIQLFDDLTSGQESQWPKISRQDIEDYISQLKSVGGFDETVGELNTFFESFKAPLKYQTRRESTFKNGSIHEADHGRNSYLPRISDETIISIRKDKARAEERLKSAEGRIRRLEDLLHRQSEPQRPLSAAGLGAGSLPTFERQISSPVPNFTSALSKAREPDPYKTTISSRRISFNQESGDTSLAQRVVTLEAELAAQKEQSKDQEKQASGGTNLEQMLKEQARDAIRTKEDLLSNFEAQKHEYNHDRRMLADENKKLKIRNEELEDEIDRGCQSQEHEYKIHSLAGDLDSARREAASELRRTRQEKEEIHQALETARESIHQMERELKQLAEEKSQFQFQADEQFAQLRTQDQVAAEHHRVLTSTLTLISDDRAPEDFAALVGKIENAVERSAAHQKGLESALESIKGDNGRLGDRLSTQADKIHNLTEELGSKREELERHSSQNTTLQSQLNNVQRERQALESRVVTGSAVADDLLERIREHERKSGELLSKVGELTGQLQDLQARFDEKRSEMASLEGSYVRLNSSHESQSLRADEISRRLLVQNLTIQHLLEQLGFSVTKQDNSLVIQKISSRTTSGSTTLNDTSTSMKRSISGPLPNKTDLESTIDPEILHWAKADDPDKVSKFFDEFINNAANFDIEVFYEAIYKRIKEVEHVARKGQRDARSYRDKAHRAQSEAHERLALRNFKEGDLALFLPTRDQATKPWAAFNVGAPHYFLREHETHKLGKRDWLIARISKVEKRVVDLSKSISGMNSNRTNKTSDEVDGGAMIDDENPYELSDGLVWYLIDAAEEKPGAPINVGLGKTTVASVNVDAKGSIRMKKSSESNGATRTLTRSLDSRRSSTNSKRGLVAVASSSAAFESTAEGPKSSHPAAIDVVETEDSSNPESSNALAVPQSQETRAEQARSVTTSPSKSLRDASNSLQKQSASPAKRKSSAWDALWSLDLNLESGKGKEKRK